MTGQVSVVIPARNDAAGLPNAVESVLRQQGVEIVEVFLCVGPSDDDTAEVAQRLATENPTVHALVNPGGGISEGLNLGLAAVTTDVMVRVDARCRLPQGYVATARSSMIETGAVNVGAVQVPVGHTPMQRAIAMAMGHRVGSGGAAYRQGEQRRQVDTAFLGVYAVDALRELGGWDERFARNEDAELNHRLALAGGEVWLEPNLRVDYEPRATLRGLARQYFDYGWWRRRMVARHRVLQLRQVAAPVIVAGSAVGIVLGVVASPWFFMVPVSYVALLGAVAATLDSEALRSATPSSAWSNSDMPSSATPNSDTPNSDMLRSATPSSAWSNADMPSSDMPSSATPNSDMLRSATPLAAPGSGLAKVSLGDRARAAASMAVMHLSWGAGFLGSTFAMAIRSEQWRN